MSTRKVPIKLKEHEALVVADVSWIEYTIDLLKYLSSQAEWRQESTWLKDMADNCQVWLNQTRLDDIYDEN